MILIFFPSCMLINIVRKDMIRPVRVLLYSRIDWQHLYISRTNLFCATELAYFFTRKILKLSFGCSNAI
jgi:hypothetical protein